MCAADSANYQQSELILNSGTLMRLYNDIIMFSIARVYPLDLIPSELDENTFSSGSCLKIYVHMWVNRKPDYR